MDGIRAQQEENIALAANVDKEKEKLDILTK